MPSFINLEANKRICFAPIRKQSNEKKRKYFLLEQKPSSDKLNGKNLEFFSHDHIDLWKLSIVIDMNGGCEKRQQTISQIPFIEWNGI